jgi:monoamine oxidase
VHTTLMRAVVSLRPVGVPGRGAVVIGSGFGGLAAAVRLRARGYE